MNNYSNNNRGGRNDSRGSDRPRFNSRNSGPNQMHDATCGDCGNNCKVPFMPTSGKPVYCSNCFEKRGNGKGDSRRPNFSNRQSFSGRSNHSDRPSYSNKSNYSDKKSFTPKPAKDYTPQLEMLNTKFDLLNNKLDEIIQILSKKSEIKSKTKKIATVVEKVSEEKAPAKTKVAAKKKAATKTKAVAKKKAPAKKKTVKTEA